MALGDPAHKGCSSVVPFLERQWLMAWPLYDPRPGKRMTLSLNRTLLVAPPPLSICVLLPLTGRGAQRDDSSYASGRVIPWNQFSCHRAPMEQPLRTLWLHPPRSSAGQLESPRGPPTAQSFGAPCGGALCLGDVEPWGPEVRRQEEWPVGQRLRGTQELEVR